MRWKLKQPQFKNQYFLLVMHLMDFGLEIEHSMGQGNFQYIWRTYFFSGLSDGTDQDVWFQ